jgi:hypothetical protein
MCAGQARCTRGSHRATRMRHLVPMPSCCSGENESAADSAASPGSTTRETQFLHATFHLTCNIPSVIAQVRSHKESPTYPPLTHPRRRRVAQCDICTSIGRPPPFPAAAQLGQHSGCVARASPRAKVPDELLSVACLQLHSSASLVFQQQQQQQQLRPYRPPSSPRASSCRGRRASSPRGNRRRSWRRSCPPRRPCPPR